MQNKGRRFCEGIGSVSLDLWGVGFRFERERRFRGYKNLLWSNYKERDVNDCGIPDQVISETIGAIVRFASSQSGPAPRWEGLTLRLLSDYAVRVSLHVFDECDDRLDLKRTGKKGCPAYRVLARVVKWKDEQVKMVGLHKKCGERHVAKQLYLECEAIYAGVRAKPQRDHRRKTKDQRLCLAG